MSNEQQKSIVLSSSSMMPSTSTSSDQHPESRKRNNSHPATTSSQMNSSQPKQPRPTIPSAGETVLPQGVGLNHASREKYERWSRKQKVFWSTIRQTSSSSHKTRESELEPQQQQSSSAERSELLAVTQYTYDFKDATTTSTSEGSSVVDTSEETKERSTQIQQENHLQPWEQALIRGVLESFLLQNPDPKTIYAHSILRL